MDIEFSFLLILIELVIVHAQEVSKRYQENSQQRFQDAHEFFEKASHEAVTLMVFFQVLSISFLILKFSSIPNLVIWLSFVFLVYTVYGPYFCLKWLLVLASCIWQVCRLLWKHPYLIATGFVGYALFRIVLVIVNKCSALEGEVFDAKTVVMKLDSVEMKTEQLTDKTQQLSEELANLATAITRLEERVRASAEVGGGGGGNTGAGGGDGGRDVMSTPVAYPLDRRRSRRIVQLSAEKL